MKLHATHELLPSLYRPEPKVLLLDMPESESTRLRSRLPDFLFIPVHRHEIGIYILGDGESENAQLLSVPPANVQCVWSSEPQAAWEELLQWWKEYGDNAALPAFVAGDQEALLKELLLIALQENRQLVKEKMALSTAGIQLRQQHEKLRAAFGTLRERFVISNRDVMSMEFSSHPLEETVELPESVDTALMQRLPGDGYGLACIDLFVKEALNYPGTWMITLRCDVSRRAVARWQIPLHGLQAGWHHLWLSEALDEHHESLSLHMRFQRHRKGQDLAPALCLAQTAHENLQSLNKPGRMLACRLWHGTPGERYYRTSEGNLATFVGSDETSPVIQYRFPKDIFMHFANACEVTSPHPYFKPSSDGKLLLHPVKDAVTCARLDRELPSRTIGARVMAHIGSERCTAKVNIRMAIGAPQATAEDILEGRHVFADSGWVVVEQPTHRYLLEAHCPQDAALLEEASLFLFSRPHGEENPRFAWLYYSELQASILC